MLLACLAFPIMAVGEENVSYSEMMARLQQLEAQMESQQRQFSTVSYEMGGGAHKGDVYESCCDPCASGGFYALYENVFVQPYFTRDAAVYVEDRIPNTSDSFEEIPFDWDLSYSPRFELGYLNPCGLGARARYWYFDDHAVFATDFQGESIVVGYGDDAFVAIDNGGADIFVAQHALKLDVLDFEALVQRGAFTFAAGLRYVQMEQLYEAVDVDNDDRITFGHDFEGVGLTMAAEGMTPSRWCGISFFAKARASFVYGESTSFATDNDPPIDLIVRENNGDLIAIGEMQIGLDWRRCVGNGILFVTAAVETQYWVNAGTAAPGLVDDDDPSYHDESAQAADMGFLGGVIGIGFLR